MGLQESRHCQQVRELAKGERELLLLGEEDVLAPGHKLALKTEGEGGR